MGVVQDWVKTLPPAPTNVPIPYAPPVAPTPEPKAPDVPWWEAPNIPRNTPAPVPTSAPTYDPVIVPQAPAPSAPQTTAGFSKPTDLIDTTLHDYNVPSVDFTPKTSSVAQTPPVTTTVAPSDQTVPTVTPKTPLITPQGLEPVASDNNAALLGTLASLFPSQSVGGSSAPYSFAPTGTGEVTPVAAPTSKGPLIIVLLICGGLAFWYYKKHHKKHTEHHTEHK